MAFSRTSIPILLDASGNATVYSGVVSGFIESIRIDVPANHGVVNASFVISTEVTGETVLAISPISLSASFYPRVAVCDPATGSTRSYSTGGTPVVDTMCIANERIKIVVSGGGNANLATVHLTTS